jgi:hypothetical protein
VTETLSVAYLLGALQETCAARGWSLHLHYYPRHDGWTVSVWRHMPDVPGAHRCLQSESLAEALADCWAQVQRHAREEATRRAG